MIFRAVEKKHAFYFLLMSTANSSTFDLSSSSSLSIQYRTMPAAAAPEDRSSLSTPNLIAVKHIDWRVDVDFEAEVLHGEATYTLDYVTPAARVVRLDTNFLKILKVVHAGSGEPLDYTLHPLIPNKPHLGQQLSISLPKDSVDKVKVLYQTTRQSSAVQWLPPAQTAGGQFPYLFTQCQAIHARALIPCQDRPGVKTTYSAQVTVPSWATCVMSAVMKKVQEHSYNQKKVFYWDQPVPISSYLIALAVGELNKIDISDRCAVWSEPSVVQQAAYEFAQTEDFLKIAEEIAGKPYVWGRYDLLMLPPSFPYGGMENPCLTFVTPTLLAGDRSLADVVGKLLWSDKYIMVLWFFTHDFLVTESSISPHSIIIAHEIAHSWTGNLVSKYSGRIMS
jgi:leukotriene-A4 hydrolase